MNVRQTDQPDAARLERSPRGALRAIVFGLLLTTLALTGTGCNDTFLDPFDNDQRYFTVFGYLDPLQTRHTVRVIPISRFREDIQGPAEDQAFIDARVYTRNLTDSTSTLWQHELKRLEDGSYVHLYHANFFVRSGVTYRLDVIRNDGITNSSTTKVPSTPSKKIVLASGPTVRSDGSITQEVRISDVDALWDLQAVYLVEGPGYRDRVFVPYDKPQAPGDDGLWRFQLDLLADQDSIISRAQAFMRRQGGDQLPVTLTAIGVQFRIIDGAWYPLFLEDDLDVLSQPGVLSNVVNGYGLFGSLGLHREEWAVSSPIAESLGYPIQVCLE